MFAITFIRKDGFLNTVLGNTLSECKKEAKLFSKFIDNQYLLATVPYAVYPLKRNGYIWNCKIPFEIAKSFGMQTRLLIEDNQNGLSAVQ